MEIYKKRWPRKCIALSCSLVIALSTLNAAATDTVENLENQTSSLESELNGINQELYALSEEIASAEMQIEMLEGERLRTQTELETAKEQQDQYYQNMKARIQYMYEHGNASLLEMIFSAKGMADFLNRVEFIENLSEYDRNSMKELQELYSRIEEEKKTLEQEQASLEELKSQMGVKKASLQKKAASASADLKKVQAALAKAREEEARNLAKETSADTSENADKSPVQTQNRYSASSKDVTLLAALLDCEAIHKHDAMLAVATVVMNRVNSPRFPNTISGVIYAKGQFSPTWTGKLAKKLKRGPSSLALKVAQEAVNGARLSAVSNCYFFLYAPSTKRKGINIGDNLFFTSW